jgi:hypothetical protein
MTPLPWRGITPSSLPALRRACASGTPSQFEALRARSVSVKSSSRLRWARQAFCARPHSSDGAAVPERLRFDLHSLLQKTGMRTCVQTSLRGMASDGTGLGAMSALLRANRECAITNDQRNNSLECRRNLLNYVLKMSHNILEINRKISVAPMMDWTDNENSSDGSTGYEPPKSP